LKHIVVSYLILLASVNEFYAQLRCGPNGDLLLVARPEETLPIADVIPSDFGPTHPEGDYLKDRRPELYYGLVAKNVGFERGYTYFNKSI
jgi:hypothetical protein